MRDDAWCCSVHGAFTFSTPRQLAKEIFEPPAVFALPLAAVGVGVRGPAGSLAAQPLALQVASIRVGSE